MSVSPDDQLEFFEGPHQSLPRPKREMIGRLLVQVRYDQLVIVAIVGVIGLTVIFACGVERGKQLARIERPLGAPSGTVSARPAATSAREPVAAQPLVSASPTSRETPDRAVSPAAPKANPSKVAASKPRYAIQVMTFSQSKLAKQELERLRAKGERAFLVIRDGRTSVYVGPFPSKQNAGQRLAALKSTYQDCFVKHL